MAAAAIEPERGVCLEEMTSKTERFAPEASLIHDAPEQGAMLPELVERAQRGDREAFEALVRDAIDRLYGAAVLILRDRAAAEDAVQETLIRVWRGLPNLRNVERFGSWAHHVLVHACLDAARRERGVRVLRVVDDPAARMNIESEVGNRDEVGRALGRLEPHQRAVLVLRYFLDLTVPEIAVTLGVPLGTAKSRLHHAEREMRAAVEAEARTVNERVLA